MSKSVTNYPKIVFEWGKKLGDKDKPYAKRWRFDFFFFSFRIHKWLCSDDTRAYHSHPVNMLIFILSGNYIDKSIKEIAEKTYSKESKLYKAGQFRYIPRDFRHYVDNVRPNTWTILFTWGIPKRWYFWDKRTYKRVARDKYFLENSNHVCD